MLDCYWGWKGSAAKPTAIEHSGNLTVITGITKASIAHSMFDHTAAHAWQTGLWPQSLIQKSNYTIQTVILGSAWREVRNPISFSWMNLLRWLWRCWQKGRHLRYYRSAFKGNCQVVCLDGGESMLDSHPTGVSESNEHGWDSKDEFGSLANSMWDLYRACERHWRCCTDNSMMCFSVHYIRVKWVAENMWTYLSVFSFHSHLDG